MGLRQPGRRRQISIHAPREGCDLRDNAAKLTQAQFQSTHPVRGATHRIRVGFLVLGISIHAPREGCDLRVDEGIHPPERFQSTHPVRGATVLRFFLFVQWSISIHAPREGCDLDDLGGPFGR